MWDRSAELGDGMIAAREPLCQIGGHTDEEVITRCAQCIGVEHEFIVLCSLRIGRTAPEEARCTFHARVASRSDNARVNGLRIGTNVAS